MSPEAFTIHSPCGLVCHPLDVGPEGGGAKTITFVSVSKHFALTDQTPNAKQTAKP